MQGNQPKLNKSLAKVNKTWAECKANQAKVKQGPSQNKQIQGNRTKIKQDPSQSKHDLGWMQGTPSQS